MNQKHMIHPFKQSTWKLLMLTKHRTCKSIDKNIWILLIYLFLNFTGMLVQFYGSVSMSFSFSRVFYIFACYYYFGYCLSIHLIIVIYLLLSFEKHIQFSFSLVRTLFFWLTGEFFFNLTDALWNILVMLRTKYEKV